MGIRPQGDFAAPVNFGEAASGVALRAGIHCVMLLLARFGATTCRASFAMYNTRAEVDILAQVLVTAQEFVT